MNLYLKAFTQYFLGVALVLVGTALPIAAVLSSSQNVGPLAATMPLGDIFAPVLVAILASIILAWIVAEHSARQNRLGALADIGFKLAAFWNPIGLVVVAIFGIYKFVVEPIMTMIEIFRFGAYGQYADDE